MSARVCLLCGKALSRIWVGAGEDFCSREHRNQYRLRLGMDRLNEASKVASLMRRRENPKPIPDLDQRGNDETRPAETAQVRISGKRSSLSLPSSRCTTSVRLPNSRGLLQRYQPRVSDGVSRAFSVPKPKTPRVIPRDPVWEMEPAGANYLERIKQTLEVRGAGKNGKALRVSSGAGFRLPVKRTLEFRPTMRKSAMIWPSRVRARTPDTLNIAANYTVPGIKFQLPTEQMPELPVPDRKAVLLAREPIAYTKRVLPGKQPLEVRPADKIWTAWDQATPQPIPYEGRKMAPPKFVHLPNDTIPGDPNTRLVLVPIMPEDRAIGYIPAIVVSPAGLTGVPKATLEDQFDSGLRNWIGETETWVLDAAGARTGSLALFSPSLDRQNYEMEFLTRIDNRSVTWVFRAPSLTEYHQASITINAEGGYEFSRGTVRGAQKELSDPSPIGVALNRKNAVTIKLRAQGNEFSVSLDGQVIDSWSDSRLPMGGIGFSGAPDDRARIYWVRLSPLGNPGKEYPRR